MSRSIFKLASGSKEQRQQARRNKTAQVAFYAYQSLRAGDRERTIKAVTGHVEVYTGAPRQQALVLVEVARRLLIEANQYDDSVPLGRYIDERRIKPNADCW